MVARFKEFKKRTYRSVFFLILGGIFLFGLTGFLVVSNWKINQKRAELINRIESLKKEVQILEEENKKLETGIAQTGKETYWEEKIREQGYKKPGEEAVVVLPPEEKKAETPEEKSFFERFLEKLGF